MVDHNLTAPPSQASYHELKCWPEFFQKVVEGKKSFEIRYNDRNYAVGHVVELQEFDPRTNTYSGRKIAQRILFITDFLQREGYVVMQLGKIYP